MAWIVGWDGPLNAFPSLHAGFLIYTAALTWRMFRGQCSPNVIVGGVLWGALILMRRSPPGQHYALDLGGRRGARLHFRPARLAWIVGCGCRRHDGAKQRRRVPRGCK